MREPDLAAAEQSLAFPPPKGDFRQLWKKFRPCSACANEYETFMCGIFSMSC